MFFFFACQPAVGQLVHFADDLEVYLLNAVSSCEWRLWFRSCLDLMRVNTRHSMNSVWLCCAEIFSGDVYVFMLFDCAGDVKASRTVRSWGQIIWPYLILASDLSLGFMASGIGLIEIAFATSKIDSIHQGYSNGGPRSAIRTAKAFSADHESLLRKWKIPTQHTFLFPFFLFSGFER